MILSGPWNLQTFRTVTVRREARYPGNWSLHSASNIGGAAMVVFSASKEKRRIVQTAGIHGISGAEEMDQRHGAAERQPGGQPARWLANFRRSAGSFCNSSTMPGTAATRLRRARNHRRPPLRRARRLTAREKALRRACAEIERDLLAPNR